MLHVLDYRGADVRIWISVFVMTIAALIVAPLQGQTHASGVWTGDWHGTLAVGETRLRLVLTIREGPPGRLTGALESIDQSPGRPLALTSLSVADGVLSFAMPAMGISYEGRWDVAGDRFAGTFRQRAEIPLVLARGRFPAAPVVEGLDGTWEGTTRRNGVDLAMVLRVARGMDGMTVTFDAPDALAFGMRVTELAREGDLVRFTVPQPDLRFEGVLAGDRLSGRWSDGSEGHFSRTAATTEARALRRPQTPRPPFPYREIEASIPNPTAPGVTLAGTLTLPPGDGPFPAAVLITGSGGQDRDETIFEHKPFAVLADHLTRRGIAVLRFDDRGVAGSTGSRAGATSADFATDANAAFAWLTARPEIDRRAIGFIGHSEGGMVGPIAAQDNRDVAFLLLLAGPGIPIAEMMEEQRRALGETQGMSEAEYQRSAPLQAELARIAASDLDDRAARAAMAEALSDQHLTEAGLPASLRETAPRQLLDPWFRWFLRYDPAPALRRFEGPILALNGALDRQVVAESNLAGIRAATAENGDVTLIVLPGLNHLFQSARTGALGEYGTIEETIAPAVLDLVADWINARFAASR